MVTFHIITFSYLHTNNPGRAAIPWPTLSPWDVLQNPDSLSGNAPVSDRSCYPRRLSAANDERMTSATAP